MQGLLISFDGVDSSGKETQAKALAERLRYQGHNVHEFVTPDYTTPSGQELKQRLQGKLGNWQETPWEKKMRYFANNRAENKEAVVRALDRRQIVIYDRYIPSSLAFVAIEALAAQETQLWRKDIYKVVEKYEYKTQGMPRENISVFLDVPPKISSELLESRKQKLEDEDEYTDHLDIQQRLYNEYDALMNEQPSRFLRIPCIDDNQLLSIQATQELVWEGLIQRFPALKAQIPKSKSQIKHK